MDDHIEMKKVELLKKNKFDIEKQRAETKMEIISFQKNLRDEESELKIKKDCEIIRGIEKCEEEYNKKIGNLNNEKIVEINEIKENIQICNNIIDIRKEVGHIKNEIEYKNKDLESVQLAKELNITEYNKILKMVPTMELDDLEKKLSDIPQDNSELEKLKENLNNKESEYSQLLSKMQEKAIFENKLLSEITDIKKSINTKTLEKTNKKIPQFSKFDTISTAATLAVESEINQLKMKEIFVANFNEKIELSRTQQDLLREYENIVKLIGVLQGSDTEWKKQLEKSTIIGKRKAALEKINKDFTKQNKQLEYQLRVIEYFI